MKNTYDALMEKISTMYPEIRKKGLETEITYSEVEKAYHVGFRRGKAELVTRIEKEDVDECLNGSKCLYLGVQVEQFINNFEDRETFGRKAA